MRILLLVLIVAVVVAYSLLRKAKSDKIKGFLTGKWWLLPGSLVLVVGIMYSVVVFPAAMTQEAAAEETAQALLHDVLKNETYTTYAQDVYECQAFEVDGCAVELWGVPGWPKFSLSSNLLGETWIRVKRICIRCPDADVYFEDLPYEERKGVLDILDYFDFVFYDAEDDMGVGKVGAYQYHIPSDVALLDRNGNKYFTKGSDTIYMNDTNTIWYIHKKPKEVVSSGKCVVCNGTGYVKYYSSGSDLESYLSGVDPYTVGTCPSCGGTG